MADLDTNTDTKTPFKPTAKASTAKDKRVKILIPKTKDATGDVPVSVNSTVWLIKRGVEVEVPPSVVEALNNARNIEYDKVVDPITGRAELIPQETMSYPFQRI